MASHSAFEGPSFRGPVFNPFDVVIIGLDTDGKFHPEMNQPRRNKLPLDTDKVATAKKHGIKPPIIVRKVTFPAGQVVFGKKLDREVPLPCAIDGRQRVKHARQATLEKRDELQDESFYVGVRAVYEAGINDVDTAVLQWSTNHFTTPPDPLTTAKEVQNLVNLMGSEEAVAEKMGWTGTQRVKEYLALGGAVEEVKDAVANGDLCGSAGARLGQYLTEKEQREVVKEAIAEGKTTVKAIEEKIRDVKAKNGRSRTRKITKATFGPEFNEPVKDGKGTPQPNRRQLVAIHTELERMLEEDNRADHQALDGAVWFARWYLYGKVAPPFVLDAIVGIMKRTDQIADEDEADDSTAEATETASEESAAPVAARSKRISKKKGKTKGRAARATKGRAKSTKRFAKR